MNTIANHKEYKDSIKQRILDCRNKDRQLWEQQYNINNEIDKKATEFKDSLLASNKDILDSYDSERVALQNELKALNKEIDNLCLGRSVNIGGNIDAIKKALAEKKVKIDFWDSQKFILEQFKAGKDRCYHYIGIIRAIRYSKNNDQLDMTLTMQCIPYIFDADGNLVIIQNLQIITPNYYSNIDDIIDFGNDILHAYIGTDAEVVYDNIYEQLYNYLYTYIKNKYSINVKDLKYGDLLIDKITGACYTFKKIEKADKKNVISKLMPTYEIAPFMCVHEDARAGRLYDNYFPPEIFKKNAQEIRGYVNYKNVFNESNN